MQTCPECSSTDRKDEPGEFALLGLTGGKLQLDLDRPNNLMVVVKVTTCQSCGHVALHESR
jgi:hypothetical protein